MYMLLYNVHPFIRVDKNGQVPKDWWDVERIKEGRFELGHVRRSEEAVDLIRRLICVDQEKRFSADDALHHPWFTSSRFTSEVCQSLSLIEDEISAANDDENKNNRNEHQFY